MIESLFQILLPSLALLLFVIPKKYIGFFSCAVIILGSIRVILGVLNSLYSFDLPFGVQFTPLASLFAISVVIVACASSVYSCGYIKEYLNHKSRLEFAVHFFSFVLLFFSMVGVLSADSKTGFLFSWELMSLSSFVLVLWNADESRKILHAALGYLVLMHVGFFFLLFGFYLLPANQGLMGYGAMPIYVWLLFFAGFGIKVGVFPMHGWLPVAHPAAPSHVSALMSAAMLNMGIYGIFRATLGASDILTTGIILFAFGAVTALYGVYRSAGESHLKRLLAYSSIDNMGVILIAIGIGAIGKATGSSILAFCGYSGALIHMLCHSSFKSLLFMNAGAIQHSAGTLNLDALGGLLKKMPITGTLFLLASLSAMAIPPFAGFAGEFVLLGGIFSAFTLRQDVLLALIGLILLALIGGTTILAMSKAFSRAMLSDPRRQLKKTPEEVDIWMKAGSMISCFFVLIGGALFTMIVFGRSEITFAISEISGKEIMSHTIWTIFILGLITILIAGIIFSVKDLLVLKSNRRMEPTWGCGADNLSQMTHYSASSFSSELSREMAADTSLSPIVDEGLFVRHETRNNGISDRISRNITRQLVGLMHHWTTRLAYIQTGKVNHYVFHALLFIVLICLLSLFGL